MRLIRLSTIIFCLSSIALLAQWTPIAGGDHGGANWVISDGDSVAGIHTSIDTLFILSGNTVYVKHYDGADYGCIEVYCIAGLIEGDIEATGAGYRGGSGGVSTSEISPRSRRGGRAGMSGEGSSGGCPGDTGSYGSITETVSGEAWGGGGGAGGGRGGGYGGASCAGGDGGSGNCVDVWPYFAAGGAGGYGGAGAGSCPGGTEYISGNENRPDVYMGSGGGGAGGGGNSGYITFYGDSGGPGGSGGGAIAIFADTIYISGSVISNGTSGGDGGDGGNGDYWSGDAAGGGGGGAGGGSGGGILIYAQRMELTSSAYFSVNGGSGGSGGDIGTGGPSGACGRGGDGGSGGGGGRIKIFYREDNYVNNAAFSYTAGNGGLRGEDPGGNGSPGDPGCEGISGTYSETPLGVITVTTDLPPEIPDSVFIDSIKRGAPYQTVVPTGDSIHIAPANPVSPYYIERTRYFFDFVSWDCGGDSAQWVTPVTEDSLFIAQYDFTKEYHTLVMKNPLENISGTLFVDTDTMVGVESDSQWYWWEEGTVHDIGVSAMDSVDEFRKWRFINWNDGGASAHSTSPASSAEDYIANYVARFPINISKEPTADTFGFISYDIDTFWGVNSIYQRTWWDSNSVHLLVASDYDTIDGSNRYALSYFSDGYDSSHFTEPIIAPTDYIAYYDMQHLCYVTKSPSSDTFGYLILDEDTLRGGESAGATVWWNRGSSHYVEVSETDTVDSLERYSWDSWSDSSAIGHTTTAIDTPCTLIAFYWREFNVTVEKDPSADSCGWLVLDGDTLWGTESLIQNRWWKYGSLHNIEVSDHDFCGDSIYDFDRWSVAGLTTPDFLANILSDTTFIAYYIANEPVLDIWVFDTLWDLDTVLAGEVRSMFDGEEIYIVNWSNLDIDLGLAVTDSSDWRVGYYPSDTRFSLRGRFQDDCPVDYFPLDDAILSAPHDFATSSRFGPDGFGLQFDPPDTMFLWLQFCAPVPRDSTLFGEKILKINILAVPSMD